MIHIWHEDSERSVTQQFWEFLREQHVFAHLGSVEIRAFGHNVDLFRHLKRCTFTPTDTYYIFMDYALDNPDVSYLIKATERVIKNKANVYLVPLLCFEYLLLQSNKLCEWSYPKRLNAGYTLAMKARNAFVKCVENSTGESALDNLLKSEEILGYLCRCYNTDIKSLSHLRLSTERIAALIVQNLFNSLTLNFQVTKTKWGSCWTCTCCNNPKGALLCNVYKRKWNKETKANILYTGTRAKMYIEGRNK